jgi:large subunit ribosomal protein L21
MYAIVKCGGKQVKASVGDVLIVEKLAGEVDSKITLDQVILLADGDKITVGAPLVSGASVTATVLEQRKGEKVIIFKKKRRQNYRRKNGHRQLETVLKVTGVSAK